MFRTVMMEDFATLLQKYLVMGDTMIATLKNACNTENIELLTRTAHSFGSSSHQLGAVKLKNILVQLEHDAKDMAQAEQLLLIENSCEQFTEVKIHLQKFL